ncbi:MAG TPA: DNA polymerase subunit beta [Planctomycetes bacterium]|nr:DNA polymerase subunit beta [Planctomycetota bacterium]
MENKSPELPRASSVLGARREALIARARASARDVARLLVREFGAKRVWLFGSLAAGAGFRRNSDIDLAVEGLDPDDFFRAVGRSLGVSEFSIDLKPMEELPPAWREKILTEGEVLA